MCYSTHFLFLSLYGSGPSPFIQAQRALSSSLDGIILSINIIFPITKINAVTIKNQMLISATKRPFYRYC